MNWSKLLFSSFRKIKPIQNTQAKKARLLVEALEKRELLSTLAQWSFTQTVAAPDNSPAATTDNTGGTALLNTIGMGTGSNGYTGHTADVASDDLVSTPGTAGVAIASATEAGTTATITNSAANSFVAGQQVTIGGSTLTSGYKGLFTITSVLNATQFTYTAAAGLTSPATGVSGATATLTEQTLRVRGAPNNGWATHAAGAPQYSQGIEMDVSTAGYANVQFSFDWYSTTQGIRDLQFQYNTNTSNSAGWTNFGGTSPTGTYIATANDFYNAPGNPTITVDLSSIAGANNDPTFGVRLVSAFDSTGNLPNEFASAALTSGHTVIYNNTSGNWRFDNLTLTGSQGSSAPAITSANSTSVYAGQAATFQVNTTGSPAPTFSLTGAPSWVTISSAGLLSFATSRPAINSSTPYLFTINASNSVLPNAQQSFTVTDTVAAPSFTSGNSTSVYAGLSGTFQVTTVAGPATTGYSLAGAPSWVSINNSGLITFTNPASVTTTTPVTFTLKATNLVGTTQENFTVTELPTVVYSTQNTPYNQTFTTLPTADVTPVSGTGTPVGGPYDLTGASPNGFGASGLTGWYGGNLVSGAEKFGVGEGGATTGALMAFHNNASSTNMALGTISTTSTASRFGVVFTNNTGLTLNNLSLSYISEEWREGTAAAGPQNVLNFSYAIGSANILAGTFVAVSALSFTSPHDGDANAGTALDGSLSQNQVPVSVTLNGFSWGPGQALEIVWDKGTGAGQSDGLGIQNLTFSAQHLNQFAPSINSAGSATVYVGQYSNFQITSSGFPVPTFSLSGQPAWAAINSATGLITFTNPPAVTSRTLYSFTVTATNVVSPDATQTFSVEELPVPSAFTAGNLIVLQSGDGTAYTNTAPTFLDEYTTTANTSQVQQVAIPTSPGVGISDNQPITLDLTAAAGNGQLTRSFDGSVLTFGGLDSGPNNTSATGGADRTVAQIGVNPALPGGINTELHGQFDTGDDLRGAVELNAGSANSATVYTVGHQGVGGTRYFNALAPSSGTLISQNVNSRGVTIGFDGRLYYSSASGTGGAGIYTETAALPTAQPGADTLVVAAPNNQGKLGGIFLADMNGDGLVNNGDRLYFVDDGTVGSGFGGLYVSTFSAGAWGTPVNLGDAPSPTGTAGAAGQLRGLTGTVVSATEAILYATSDDGVAGDTSYLVKFDDTNGTGPATMTVLQSLVETNKEAFRGVALAPVAPTTLTETITPNPTNPAIQITFKANVSSSNAPGGINGGVVYFIDSNSNSILNPGGTNIVNGVATFQTSTLNAAQYNVHAYYAGTASIAAATSAATPLSITGTHTSSTTVASAPNSSTVGLPVTITATVSGSSGNPTGTVTFKDGGNTLGTGTLSTTAGVTTAILVTNTLSLGSHTITAAYSGDNTYLTSNSANTDTQVVNAGATLTLSDGTSNGYGTVTAGATVTFTAKVTGNGVNGSPSGAVQFFEDGSTTPFATGALTGSGNALTATGATTIGQAGNQINNINGSHLITATYVPGGSSVYIGVSSSPPWIETAKQNFGIGNLIVLDRPNQPSNASQIVSVLEYTTNGQLVQTVTLPDMNAGATHTFGLSGHASTEGTLGLSGNQSLLSLFGFDLPVGTVSATSTSVATNPRTVVSINNAGGIDSSTTVEVPTNNALLNPRGAVTNDGKEYWVVGDGTTGTSGNTGIQYATEGTLNNPPTAIGTNGLEGYGAEILGGNLYVSTGATGGSSNGVDPVIVEYVGLPTGSAVGTPLPGLGAAYAGEGFINPAPYGFLLFNHLTGTAVNPDTLYIADQTYGLLKFYFDGTNWQFLSEKLNNNTSVEGLVGYETLHDPFNGGNPSFTLYATAALSNGNPSNQLLSFTDNAAYNQPNTGGLFNVIANAVNPTDTFSGLAFAPLNTTTTTLTSSANPDPFSQSVTFTATITDTTGTFTPTGTLTFTVDGVAQTPINLGGNSGTSFTATLTIANPYFTIGTHVVTASYSGDSNNGTSSSTFTEAVDKTFVPGDLIVLRAGDGTAYTTQGPLFLDEYTPAGVLVESIPIANNEVTGGTGNQPITIDLSAAAGNGQLDRSYDGSVLTFDGVDSGVNNGIYTLPATPTGSANRVVAVTTNDPSAPNFLNTTTYGPFYVGDDNRGSVAESATGPIWTAGHPNQAGGAVSQGALFFPTVNQSNTDSLTFSTPGTVTFSYNGVAATSPFTYSATSTAASIQANLQTIPALAGTNVSVSGSAGGPFLVNFASGITGGNSLTVANGSGVASVTPAVGPQFGTQVSKGANIRAITIGFNNTLYFSTAGSSSTGLAGIYAEPQALPTQATPPADIPIAGALFTASKLGGIYLADMNGDGVIDNGDRLYFLDDGTVGGSGTGGVYVSTWNSANPANPLDPIPNDPNNHWSTAVRLGDGILQANATPQGAAQLRGLTGAVISPTEVLLSATEFDAAAGDNSYILNFGDKGSGVSIASASESGTTVTITTASPNNFVNGQTVQVDGVGTSTGAGVLNGKYNGVWQITVVDSTHFTYTDTNSDGVGLATVNNQGGADATVTPSILVTLAGGTITANGKTFAAEAIRGIAYAPVAPTSVTLAASATTVAPGTPVTFTATLSNPQLAPSGTVTFIDQNTNTVLGQGTISTTGGVTTATFSTTLVGSHFISAYFAGGGTGQLAPATSNTIQVNEAGSTTSTTVATPSISAVATGVPVTLTATVTGGSGTPAGTVSFYNGGTTLSNLLGTVTLSSGAATFVTSFATAAIQNITAIYNGNNAYATSSGTTTVTTAANASATITTSANNVALNATPTYTATINGNSTLGTPAGTVQFSIFNTFTGATTKIGSAVTLVAGSGNTASASVTSSALANPGSYLITLTFAPTGSNSPYAAFAVNTTTQTSGVALIETVKQAFTPGNLVAVQRGDGSVNLGSSGYLTFLVEYTPQGNLVQKIAMPNASSGSTNALLETGQSGAEGLLNRSANGYFLTLAGYDVPVGQQFVTSTFPFQFPRTIALVNGAGTVDTSTAISTTSSSSVPFNPLDVVSNDGKEFWLVSSLPVGDTTDSGIEYISKVGATTATQIGAADTSGTAIAIAGGQLYAASSDASGGTPVAVYQVGTNLPTGSATLSTLPGLQAAYQANFPNAENPQQMLFLNHSDGTTNNPDTLYIADLSNGLLKFALVGGVWTFEGEKLVFSGGASGVTGYVDGSGHFQVYVTGSSIPGANPNQVDSFTDTNAYNTPFVGGNFTELVFVGQSGTPAAANGNMNFAGLAFVPAAQTTTTMTSSITSAPYGTSNITLTATVTSPVDTPNGTVTFMDGTTVLGTSPVTTVGGLQKAMFIITSTLGVSNHAITATYNPGGTSLPLDGTSTGAATVAITYNPGTLVVTVVGTGTPALSSSATATFLQNFTNSGTAISANTIVLPSSGSTALTLGGTTTADGYLTDAADGHSLSVTGYNTAAGSSIPSTATREVGVVSPSGVVDVSTQLPGSSGSVHVAVSADGLGFWVATSTGIRYIPFGNPTATGVTLANSLVTAEVPSPTAVGVFAAGTTTGQLFGTAGAGAQSNGVPALDSPYSVGTGLPTNGGQAIAVSPSFPTARDAFNNFPTTNQFAISPDGNTIYIADSRTDSKGGILKYYQSSPNNWTLVDHYQIDSFSIASASETGTSVTITTNGNHDFTVGESVTIAGVSVAAYNTSSATITAATGNTFSYTVSSSGLASGSGGSATSNDGGIRAVVADFSGANPVFYATTTATSANRIVKLVDNGDLIGNAGGFTATVLATAPANEAFRGVALAPTNPGTTGSTTSLVVSNSPAAYGAGATLTATVPSDATGWVSFRVGSTEIGAAPIVGGTATFVTGGNLPASSSAYSVTAVYTGDAKYAASTSAPQSVTINQATTSTTLNLSASPVAAGISDTLTATISFPAGTAPTGTVTFKNGSTTITGSPVNVSTTIVNQSGNPVTTVTATLPTTFSPPLGTLSLSAVYSGDTNFATSTGNANLQLVAGTTTTVTSSIANPTATPSSTVTLTASVTGGIGSVGTPSGTVQFYDDLLPIGSPATLNGSGVGTVTVTTALLQATNVLTPGLHSISAIYTPDSNSTDSFFTSTGVYEQAVQAQPFGASDQFILRVGDGTTNLVAQKPNPIAGSGSIGSTIYVDEYTPAGSLVQSIALPSADGTGSQNTIHAVVGNGQQSATEQMTLSGDGQYIFVTGYDNNPLPAGTALAVPTASGNNAVPRAIARIKYDGTIQTEAFTAGSSGVQTSGNLNGVYSPDGNQFYISGANGVTYFSSFTPSASFVSATATIASTIGATATGLENYNGNLAAVAVPYTGATLVGAFTGFPKANTNAVTISTLTEATSGAGTTVTVTTSAANGFATGASVKIAGAVPSGYNGTFTVTVTSPTTFTYTAAASGLANSTTGGTATEVLTLPGLPSTDNFQQFPIDVYFTHLNGSGAPAGVNTMYISDDGPSFANGAITKWALSAGGTWSLVDTVTAGSGNSATTFYWISGSTDGSGNVTLYTTYGNGGNSVTGPGFLFSIADQNGWNAPIGTGGAHSNNVATVATVPTGSNEIFRGVAGAPVAAVTSITDNGPNPSPLGTSVSFTVTVTGGQIGTGGTVTLEDAAHSNQVVGTGTLVTGSVTVATTTLPVGTDKIFAVYGTNQSNQVTHTVTGGAFSKYVVTIIGSSSFVAGNSFLFTVQATDSAGNAVSTYTGPSTVTISANPADPLSNFPITSGPLNSSGFGFFLGTLKTVGSYTLTASGTISSNTFTGTSSTVSVTPASAVYFTVAAPASAITGVSIPVTVTAFDLYKNVATGYTGAVKLTSTSAGNLGGVYTFTTTGTNPDNGAHTFSVTLNSGGTQTITATDTTASAPSVAGTSNPITTRGLVVTAVTPTPTGFTATFNKAFIPGDIYLYNANLTTTSDVVMVATSDIVSFSTASGTVRLIYNGHQASPTATFGYSPATTAAAFQAYLQTIQGLTATGAVVVTGPNGGPFTVNFGPGVTGGALLADLSGFASVLNAGKITGTLLVDSTNQIITFKATASNLKQKNQQVNPNDSNYSSVVLPDATYTIKLVTGTGSGTNANGFFDAQGVGLDGTNNGGASSYTTTFSTSFQANATPVLGIPDFARGPDSNTPITVPNQLSFGIPVTLYNASHVTDVTFSLTYNAALLNITGTRSGANSDATDKSGANLTLVSATSGVATFHYTDTTPISATPDAPLVLGDIIAVVPSNSGAADLSLYQVKEQLQPGNIVINSGGVTGAVGSNGIHVNAYAGDVNGDKMIDGLDKLAANFIATNTAPAGVGVGFSAYTQLDPVIIGDVAGDLSVDAGDVTTIDSYVAQLNPLQISQPPTQLLKTNPNYVDPTTIHSPNAADPTLSLVTRPLTGLGSPAIFVMIDHPDPDGSTGLTSATLALTYDPTVLSLSSSDITLGSIPNQGDGWQLTSVVDQATGQIGIQLYSSTPITNAQAGSLVNIAFHVTDGARHGVSPPIQPTVQLVTSVSPNDQWFGTSLADAQGGLILSQGVTQLPISDNASYESTRDLTSQGSRLSAETGSTTPTAREAQASAPTLALVTATQAAEADEKPPLAALSNGALAAETVHTVPASLIVSGLLAFQTNGMPVTASPLAGQVVQIANVSPTNLPATSNPPQASVDRWFQAMARATDGQSDVQGVMPTQKSLPSQLWYAFGARLFGESANPLVEPPVATDDFLSDQTVVEVGKQQPEADPVAAMDRVFADLADDMSDLGDL